MKVLSRRVVVAIVVAVVVAAIAVVVARRGRRPEAAAPVATGTAATQASAKPAHWTCPMHPEVKESEPGKCPKCGMDLVPVPASSAEPATGDRAMPPAQSPTPRGEVSIDPRRQQLIGVRTVPVERRTFQRTVRTVGVVRYDETRLADVNVKLEGWIRKLYVDYTGAPVKRGQPLFALYSPDLLAAQNEYLLALKTREEMRQSQVADARDYADRLADAARRRLVLWDLPADELREIEKKRQAQTEIVFRSPAVGFVVEKQAIEGMHVMPGQSLYRIADLSVVWVEADVYEQDLTVVRQGLSATVTFDAYPGDRFTGRVVYIYPFVAEKTRTAKVRVELANRGGRLKPGMFANVELASARERGIVVPGDALLDSGAEQVVFVALGAGYFEPRTVKVGQRLDDGVQILAGLKEGEEVATGAAFFLDSESQLRASLQGYEAPPAPMSRETEPRDRLDIALRTQPDPPRAGDNQFEVTIKSADGKPVTDAEVSIAFFMAAMPSMNMPAMRNETTLAHAGNGVYRGTGQVMMAGRWDATVTVSRGGRRIGSKQISVVAR